MTTYNNKTILLIGGQNLIDAPLVQRFLEGGAKEVRVLGSSETAMQSLREELLPETCNLNLETKKRLRFYVGDMSDNTYLEEAMSGTDFVLFIPAIPRPFDCGVVHVATDCKVKKLVVISPNRQEPLEKMSDMLAALMETVVLAEGRYLGKDSSVTICCSRINGNLRDLADHAFEKAVNGDLFVQTHEGINRFPCENYEMQRN